MKFDKTINTNYSKQVSIIIRVKRLSSICGQSLSKIIKQGDNQGDGFYDTALQFNRISYEASDAIYLLLREGHLSEVVVLLRWQLEVAHLFYFLANNKSEYTEWREGKQISPKKIGEYFVEVKLASWFKTYSNWSDVTHANHRFVEHSSVAARMTQENNDQILMIGNLIMNLMYIALKVVYVINPLLRACLQVSEYNRIIVEFNNLEELILAFSEEQGKREAERLGEAGL